MNGAQRLCHARLQAIEWAKKVYSIADLLVDLAKLRRLVLGHCFAKCVYFSSPLWDSKTGLLIH